MASTHGCTIEDFEGFMRGLCESDLIADLYEGRHYRHKLAHLDDMSNFTRDRMVVELISIPSARRVLIAFGMIQRANNSTISSVLYNADDDIVKDVWRTLSEPHRMNRLINSLCNICSHHEWDMDDWLYQRKSDLLVFLDTSGPGFDGRPDPSKMGDPGDWRIIDLCTHSRADAQLFLRCAVAFKPEKTRKTRMVLKCIRRVLRAIPRDWLDTEVLDPLMGAFNQRTIRAIMHYRNKTAAPALERILLHGMRATEVDDSIAAIARDSNIMRYLHQIMLGNAVDGAF